MREAILDEARSIVTDQGMTHLSMRAIARNLGYSPGALYEYFRDKEAILHALYFDGTQGLGQAMNLALTQLPAETSASEAIKAMGRAYRAHALDHGELYRLIFGSGNRPSQDVMQDSIREGRGGFSALLREISRGVNESTLKPMTPEVMALACWSLVHGFVGLEITGHIPDSDDPDDAPVSEAAARAFRDVAFEGVLHGLIAGLERPGSTAAPS